MPVVSRWPQGTEVLNREIYKMSKRAWASSRSSLGELSTWSGLLHDYDIRHRPKRQDELAWFATQRPLRELIRLVARAQGRRGKRLDHQRRILHEAIPSAELCLVKQLPLLQRATSFEMLLHVVEAAVLPIHGIGRLYCYDAALRFGCRFGVKPEYIYLHAGTRNGAGAFVEVGRKTRWLPREAFPEPLRNRPADEIENILCVYEHIFLRGVLPGSSVRDARAKRRPTTLTS